MKTPKNKLLTFKNGKFFLTGIAENEYLPNTWTQTKQPTIYQSEPEYSTENYEEAKIYRAFADEKTETLCKRLFNPSYVVSENVQRILPQWLDLHQKDGILHILSRGRSYLAHAPGAGKTCQAFIAALLAEGEGTTLFITPPNLIANWKRELQKFATLLDPFSDDWVDVEIIPSLSKEQLSVRWNAQFLLVPDTMITKGWVIDGLAALPKKKFIAVDEASRFKTPESDRTIALFGGTLKNGRHVPGIVHDARHVVLLDGSPMPNRPMELWAPIYALSPESIDFMTREAFGFRYCGATQDKFGRWQFLHSRHEEELHQKLTASFMHVVKEDVLNHPERLRSILPMTEDARSAEHRRWEKDNWRDFIQVASQGEQLSQGTIAKYRQELGLRKAPWVASYVASRLSDKNERILLFAWHRDVCKLLERHLAEWSPGVVIGGTPEYERESLFSAFQEGERRLLIMNIAAGGRGHNLQNADRVVFAEFSWTNETNIQCEKRASRKGSKKTQVRCEYIVSPNSMDEMVMDAIFRKEITVKKVLG